MQLPPVGRRAALLGSLGALTAGALSSCVGGGSSSEPSRLIGPHAAAVRSAELRRRSPGQRVVSRAITAQAGMVDLGSRSVSTWTYGDTLPGPLLRTSAGDLLRVEVSNRLPAETSIHWHGSPPATTWTACRGSPSDRCHPVSHSPTSSPPLPWHLLLPPPHGRPTRPWPVRRPRGRRPGRPWRLRPGMGRRARRLGRRHGADAGRGPRCPGLDVRDGARRHGRRDHARLDAGQGRRRRVPRLPGQRPYSGIAGDPDGEGRPACPHPGRQRRLRPHFVSHSVVTGSRSPTATASQWTR